MSITIRSLSPVGPGRRRTLASTAILVIVAAIAASLVVRTLIAPPAASLPARGPSVDNQSGHDAALDPADELALGAEQLQLARETADPAAYGRAEEAFQAVLVADPDNVQALIGLGSLALSRHEFADALTIGHRALALNQSVSSIYGVIGDAQVELGRYDEAIATVQRMVDLRPDLASYSRVSYLRELHGDLPGAIEAMERAVAAAGPATENTEYVRVQLGNLQLASGDLAAAERTYREALARLPNYHLALAGLARARAAGGDLDGAIALFERAKAQLPLPETVIGLGETLEAAGRRVAAADEYALAEAMQRLNAANGVRVDLELAGFFADHGDPRVAVRLARSAHAERPTIFAADTLAWALYRDGRERAAARWLDDSLRLGTRNSRLLYHAGMIEAAVGRTGAARNHLQQALGVNPRFSPLDAPRAAAALEALGR